jgi:hypothetical protein
MQEEGRGNSRGFQGQSEIIEFFPLAAKTFLLSETTEF